MTIVVCWHQNEEAFSLDVYTKEGSLKPSLSLLRSKYFYDGNLNPIEGEGRRKEEKGRGGKVDGAGSYSSSYGNEQCSELY